MYGRREKKVQGWEVEVSWPQPRGAPRSAGMLGPENVKELRGNGRRTTGMISFWIRVGSGMRWR